VCNQRAIQEAGLIGKQFSAERSQISTQQNKALLEPRAES